MDGYLSWIPTKLLDENISSGAIRLFLLVSSLVKSRGYCFASNAWLAEKLKCSTRSIQNWLGELEEREAVWVDVEHQNERKVYLFWERPKEGEQDCAPPRKTLRTPHAEFCAPIDNNQERVVSDDKHGRIAKRIEQVCIDGICPAEWANWASTKHGWDQQFIDDTFAEFFRYWSSESGQRARKLNWYATWQNRCADVQARNSRRGRANGSSLDRGLAGAMRSSVAQRHGAAQPGGGVGGGTSSGDAGADDRAAVPALPPGEIPF